MINEQQKNEEKRLISQLRTGSEQAYLQLFNTYFEPLTDYAWRIIKDTENATDIVQAVFCHMFEERQRIVITTSLKAYLYRTVYNQCVNHLRRQKIISQYADKQVLDFYFRQIVQTPEAELQLRYEEVSQHINAAIDHLPARCREVFLLSRREDKSNKEIAEMLGISVKTVEVQITKAIARLRKELEWLLVLLVFIK